MKLMLHITEHPSAAALGGQVTVCFTDTNEHHTPETLHRLALALEAFEVRYKGVQTDLSTPRPKRPRGRVLWTMKQKTPKR